MKFTINEIRNYIISQDSLGDVLYNLTENNIIKANEETPCEYCEVIPDHNGKCNCSE